MNLLAAPRAAASGSRPRGAEALDRRLVLEALFACEACGVVVAAGADAFEPVRALVREALAFEVRFGHFPIVGLCPACVDG